MRVFWLNFQSDALVTKILNPTMASFNFLWYLLKHRSDNFAGNKTVKQCYEKTNSKWIKTDGYAYLHIIYEG